MLISTSTPWQSLSLLLLLLLLYYCYCYIIVVVIVILLLLLYYCCCYCYIIVIVILLLLLLLYYCCCYCYIIVIVILLLLWGPGSGFLLVCIYCHLSSTTEPRWTVLVFGWCLEQEGYRYWGTEIRYVLNPFDCSISQTPRQFSPEPIAVTQLAGCCQICTTYNS